MTKLTKLQTSILLAAANGDDGFTSQPSDVAADKAQAAITGLIKAGLMLRHSADGADTALMITEKGRKATGYAAAPPAPPAEAVPAQAVPEPPAAKGKIGVLIALLSGPDGATIADMTEATGWQAHSVRGAMSGSLKKAMKLAVASEKTDAGRVYRIVEEKA